MANPFHFNGGALQRVGEPKLMRRAVLVIAIISAAISWPTGANGQQRKGTHQGPPTYKGRIIAPVMTAEGGGAEWLERRDRDETEQPEKVLDALKIAPDATVADIGAGTGYFSLRIAKRLEGKGRVLATDVQPEMLRRLTENMKAAGLTNVERILATTTDAKLPANQVDLAIMVDVYHELQDPEGTVAQIRRALKPDGRLVLVEYRAEDPMVPIQPVHKTTVRQMVYELEPMGFRLEQLLEFLPHQHVEVFRKIGEPGEDVLIDESTVPTVFVPGGTAPATEDFRKAAFESLSDNFDAWEGDRKIWRSIGSMVVGSLGDSTVQDVTLETREAHGDFELDLEWRLRRPGTSCGVRFSAEPSLHVVLDSGPANQSHYPLWFAANKNGEVIDSDGDVVSDANSMTRSLVRPGDWNRLTLRRQNGQVTIAINGTASSRFEATGEKAPIGLEPAAGEVQFRNIWIKPLEKRRDSNSAR